MSIYLIDYENVSSLSGINKLTADDIVIIFYSKNNETLNFEMHTKLLQAKERGVQIQYKKVNVGKTNALDFQLDTYLGYLICKYENIDTDFYIVAKDKGYPFVSTFWEIEKSIKIKLINSLGGAAKKDETVEPFIDNSIIEEALHKSDIELTDNEIKEIINIVSEHATKDKINGNLNKLFKDSKKAGSILKVITPYINKK